MYTLPVCTDVVQYILSEYIPYDELQPLQEYVAHIWINPARRQQYTHHFHCNGWNIHTPKLLRPFIGTLTVIDGISRDNTTCIDPHGVDIIDN